MRRYEKKVRMTGVEPAIPPAANFKFAVYNHFHHTRVKKFFYSLSISTDVVVTFSLFALL